MSLEQNKFWTPGVVSLVVRSFAILELAIAVSVLVYDTEQQYIGKGEFPVSYSGALAVSQGDQTRLYDQEYHRELQNRIWPHLDGKVHSYVYPVFYAGMTLPFTYFGVQSSRWIFLLSMLAALVLAVRLLAGAVPAVAKNFTNSLCTILLLPPVTWAVFCGQNTPLGLLCYGGFIYWFNRKDKHAELISGVCLGAWFFKPHYPAIALFFLLIARRWQVLLGAAIPAVAYYLWGAQLTNWHWPLTWLSAVRDYGPYELEANSWALVSLNAPIHALAHLVEIEDHYLLVNLSAGVFSAILALAVAREFYKTGTLKDGATEKNKRLKQLSFALAPLMVLLSPHTLFYDLSFVAFAHAFFRPKANDLSASLVFSLYILLMLAIRAQDYGMPLSPLAVFSFLSLYYCLREYRKYFDKTNA